MDPQALLARLEEISRERPDRLLRLQGELSAGPQGAGPEPFELLLYRGFSSSTTHPTAVDPDRTVLPPGAALRSAVVLEGPLNPAAEVVLAGPLAVEAFLDPGLW